jgi:hypothetical protein
VAALALKQLRAGNAAGPLLVFDNATGRTRDFDTRGSDAELLARVVEAFPAAGGGCRRHCRRGAGNPRGRGRPKLGVVAREVTLLPRHWAWLAEQPGGASVVLRKLVEAASRAGADKDRQRRHSERAYHFLQTIAGDLPGFEEAIRVLFAHDRAGLEAALHSWPEDVRDHALRLAFDRRRRLSHRAVAERRRHLIAGHGPLPCACFAGGNAGQGSALPREPHEPPVHPTPRSRRPLWRTYLTLLLPMLLTNALQLAAGTLDNIYLGHLLGTQAVAAAAAFFPVFFLLLALVMGLATGAMVLIGQAWGAGRPQQARAVAGSAVALILLLSVLVMAVGGGFAPQLLAALGTPARSSASPSSMRACCCWRHRRSSCCGWPPP